MTSIARVCGQGTRGVNVTNGLDSRVARDSRLRAVDDLLSIGRFARITGLTIGALGHYDELGLLAPARVDPETAYRFYRREQAADARLVARLRELDVPLTL